MEVTSEDINQIKGKELPKVKGSPIVGSLISFAKARSQFVEEMVNKIGNIFQFSMLGVGDIVIIHGNEYLQEFYNEENITRSHPINLQLDLLAGGKKSLCLFLDGKEHKERKKILLELLTNESRRDIWLPIMDKVITETLSEWENQQHVKLQHAIVEFTVRFYLSVIAGLNSDEINKSIKSHIEHTQNFLKATESAAHFHWEFTNYGKGYHASKLIFEFYQKRLREFENSESENVPCVLSEMIKLNKNQPKEEILSEKQQIAELTHMSMAISSIMIVVRTLMLQLGLNENKEVKAKLQEKIGNIEIDHTIESMRNIDPFVGQTVKEVQRMGPNIILIPAVSKRDFIVGGYLVPKGKTVMASVWTTNHDNQVYTNPEKFDPDRFSVDRSEDELNAKCPYFAYIPVGGGDHKITHRCAGEDFVTDFLKLFLVRIFQGYDWKLDDNQSTQNRWNKFDPCPKDGVKITITRK